MQLSNITALYTSSGLLFFVYTSQMDLYLFYCQKNNQCQLTVTFLSCVTLYSEKGK